MLDGWLSHQGKDELRLNATLYLFSYTQIPVHKLTMSPPGVFLSLKYLDMFRFLVLLLRFLLLGLCVFFKLK